jgi:hypothetical protein
MQVMVPDRAILAQFDSLSILFIEGGFAPMRGEIGVRHLFHHLPFALNGEIGA